MLLAQEDESKGEKTMFKNVTVDVIFSNTNSVTLFSIATFIKSYLH